MLVVIVKMRYENKVEFIWLPFNMVPESKYDKILEYLNSM